MSGKPLVQSNQIYNNKDSGMVFMQKVGKVTFRVIESHDLLNWCGIACKFPHSLILCRKETTTYR